MFSCTPLKKTACKDQWETFMLAYLFIFLAVTTYLDVH
jgi:hypothetical protein